MARSAATMGAALFVVLALLASPVAAKWGDRTADKAPAGAARSAAAKHGGKGVKVANTTDVDAVYEFSIGLAVTAAQFKAAAQAFADGKSVKSVGTPGLQIAYDFSADSFDGISPAFGASGFAAFANDFTTSGCDAKLRGLKNFAVPDGATITYSGRVLQEDTQSGAGNLPLFPSGLKIKFVNDVLTGRRKLLAPVNPPCDFTIVIGNDPQNPDCEVTYGGTAPTFTFGGVSETLSAFYQRSLGLTVSCTIPRVNAFVAQFPPNCLSTI